LVERRFSSEVWLFSLFKTHRGFPWWGLILCAPPFLAGCTTLTAPNQKNAAVRTIIIEPVDDPAETKSADFNLVGRVSVKGGKESFSGGVQWHHTKSDDEILLLSPLGQTVAQIQRNSAGVYLTTSEQESYYAADVESLTEQVLGWRLPLMGLQYWVQSVNSPATISAIDLDMDGRMVAIRQDGWQIDYSNYFSPLSMQNTQATQAQPARRKILLLKRSGLQIKLVIDDWNLGTFE
jgi:outer membrane lipoprotein LolB